MDRHLAAILAADVAGYSRLMGADEDGTVRAMQDCRGLLFSTVAQHAGRVINTAGDSVLAEFVSVVGAVRCAVEIQRSMQRRNGDVPASKQFQFRIGVHQGEIIVGEGDVYGDGINVGARLQSAARPGGIAISGRVHEDVVGKVDVGWTGGGEQTLKNIARPVHVWHWADAPASARPTVSPVVADRPSIAVLPFVNLGGPSDDTVFSDGITEDIIIGLARFRSLFVVARHSSFAFRDKADAPTDVGRQLGVSFLLKGSVRRSKDRIRVSAQLIDVQGLQLWGEHYDRGLVEIFDVQDEVATTIVSTLVGRIEASKLDQTSRKPTENLAAYDLLLHGIDRFRNYDQDANREACHLLERAIASDSHCALAHAYLGLVQLALNGYGAAPIEVRDSSCRSARRGVELDSQNAGCHRILAYLLLCNRHYDSAEHHANRAVELNPNDADGLTYLGYILVQRGRPHEGLVSIEKATRLNPFHPPWYNIHLSAAYYSLGRFADAAKAAKRILGLGGSSFRLAAACGQLGDHETAKLAADALLAANPDCRVDELMKEILLEKEEDRAQLREGLIKAGLPA